MEVKAHARRTMRLEHTRVVDREREKQRIEIAPKDNYALHGNTRTTVRRPDYTTDPTWWKNGSYGRREGGSVDLSNAWRVTGSGPAPGLEPTPLRKGDAPGTEVYVNTIQNPHVAPKSNLRGAVNAAIDKVREQGIGMDPNDPERNTIADFDAYHNAVVTELRRQGYNAAHDGEELAIGRGGDGHSEQWDISTSTGKVRRFYAAWQSPPVFEDGAGDHPRADPSGLEPSRIVNKGDGNSIRNTIEHRGIAPDSKYADAVNEAIDAVRARGIGIDTNDPERNTISNYELYHHAVVMELRRRGLDAAHDGEELAISRPGDDHSEQFDISTATGLVRRFYASWNEPSVFANP